MDGLFSTFDAKITAKKEDLSDAVFEVTMESASVSTDNEMRDGHLKKPDMFDVEKFPTISFKSTSISKGTDNHYTLKGNLTMKGVTKEISLDMLVMGFTNNRQGKKVAGIKITGMLKRTDFGVGAMPNSVASEEVLLRAVGEFIKN
ncbi:MAG: YceI family protein [Saprospiraceae bacterium]|nr:YceI family protein [Saprospiraceae bacterium]